MSFYEEVAFPGFWLLRTSEMANFLPKGKNIAILNLFFFINDTEGGLTSSSDNDAGS